MMKALWLTSWYPNRLDAMNGDFVQRHARAASLYNNVHVIHLEPDKQNVLKQRIEISFETQGNLTEEIILYKLSKIPIAGKYFSFLRYKSIFKKHISAYIKRYGKPGIVHVHVPMKAGILALWLKRKYGVPYIITEHWAIYNDEAPDAYNKRNIFFKNYTRKIFKEAKLFTPVSEELARAVAKFVLNVPYNVVPNVVDTRLFKYEKNNIKGEFVFLHVSTLTYQKNVEGILRAFKQFAAQNPTVKLVIVGGGEEKLKEYSTILNIPAEAAHFTSLVVYKTVAEIMQKSSALVMFSRYENLPCVITEALCSGLPVISTNVGGIGEVVNSTNGILIENGNEGALLKAMLELYANMDNYNGYKIATAAKQLYSYDKIGKQLTEIYASVAAVTKHVTLVNN